MFIKNPRSSQCTWARGVGSACEIKSDNGNLNATCKPFMTNFVESTHRYSICCGFRSHATNAKHLVVDTTFAKCLCSESVQSIYRQCRSVPIIGASRSIIPRNGVPSASQSIGPLPSTCQTLGSSVDVFISDTFDFGNTSAPLELLLVPKNSPTKKAQACDHNDRFDDPCVQSLTDPANQPARQPCRR